MGEHVEFNIMSDRECKFILDLIDRITEKKLKNEMIIKIIQLITQKIVSINITQD